MSLVEVLVASLVIGVSVIALSLMFANGSAWVSAMGEDRVAAGLAQQRIEQVRAAGWDAQVAAVGITTENDLDPVGCSDIVNSTLCRRTVKYTLTTCIQYVDASSADGLNTPPHTADCPPGDASSAKRITVTAEPVFVGAGGADQTVQRAPLAKCTPATDAAEARYGACLQGWITQAGR